VTPDGKADKRRQGNRNGVSNMVGTSCSGTVWAVNRFDPCMTGTVIKKILRIKRPMRDFESGNFLISAQWFLKSVEFKWPVLKFLEELRCGRKISYDVE
jgi:hypothetical protein